MCQYCALICDALQVPNQRHEGWESALCGLNFNIYCPIVTGVCRVTRFRLNKVKKISECAENII